MYVSKTGLKCWNFLSAISPMIKTCRRNQNSLRGGTRKTILDSSSWGNKLGRSLQLRLCPGLDLPTPHRGINITIASQSERLCTPLGSLFDGLHHFQGFQGDWDGSLPPSKAVAWKNTSPSEQMKGRPPYQSIKHQGIKRFTLRVLHHDVEQGIQGVLQEL